PPFLSNRLFALGLESWALGPGVLPAYSIRSKIRGPWPVRLVGTGFPNQVDIVSQGQAGGVDVAILEACDQLEWDASWNQSFVPVLEPTSQGYINNRGPVPLRLPGVFFNTTRFTDAETGGLMDFGTCDSTNRCIVNGESVSQPTTDPSV